MINITEVFLKLLIRFEKAYTHQDDAGESKIANGSKNNDADTRLFGAISVQDSNLVIQYNVNAAKPPYINVKPIPTVRIDPLLMSLPNLRVVTRFVIREVFLIHNQ
jgi:hypothetical protein